MISTNPSSHSARREMAIALSGEMMRLEDKTTKQIPIPHKDSFEIHALFSNALAWMQVRTHITQQRDRPSESIPRFRLG